MHNVKILIRRVDSIPDHVLSDLFLDLLEKLNLEVIQYERKHGDVHYTLRTRIKDQNNTTADDHNIPAAISKD